MDCQVVQNQILALPDPRRLPPALLAHVEGCAACRAWARQAARLEGLIAQLPAPPAPADKKGVLIGELLAADPVIHPMVVPARRPGLPALAWRAAVRNPRYVGGLAAALLVAVGGVWLANRPKSVQPEFVQTERHSLLESMVKRDVALARADTPAKRLEVLGGMAEDLAGETRGMARVASPAELKDLARWYDKVVADGVVRQAKDLPPHTDAAEKRRLLANLKARLEADAAAADALAGEAPQDAQPALKRMADTARDGARELSRAGGGI